MADRFGEVGPPYPSPGRDFDPDPNVPTVEGVPTLRGCPDITPDPNVPPSGKIFIRVVEDRRLRFPGQAVIAGDRFRYEDGTEIEVYRVQYDGTREAILAVPDEVRTLLGIPSRRYGKSRSEEDRDERLRLIGCRMKWGGSASG